ncbi:hypothetical protein CCACVL1_06945 [Corchorus capsularis]|uniref:Uncharacterized protein n=1 Tax=Corchorus capsularis TaxID=210143 RepID=A0A1R3JAY0_COCAP|nr:hypothetical protein CCACVL1_06945 [Corchorus capsularis]
MEDSGTILLQISCLKDMLDQVNEEIEANIQITREIESEIVREEFTKMCLEFQRDIENGDNSELVTLLSEKELLKNEIHLLEKKNNALSNSMSAFVEEILEDLYTSNAGVTNQDIEHITWMLRGKISCILEYGK